MSLFSPLESLVVMGLLLGFASLQIPKETSNYYEILDLPVDSEHQEILYQYDKKIHHLEFSEHLSKREVKVLRERLTDAVTVLANETLRASYESFGHSVTGRDVPEIYRATYVVFNSLIFQALSNSIAYIATIPKPFRHSRQIFSMISIGTLCFELNSRFLGGEYNVGYPHWDDLLVFERIELIQRLYPTVLGFLMFFSYINSRDEKEKLYRLLHGVLLTNRLLCENVQKLRSDLVQQTRGTVQNM